MFNSVVLLVAFSCTFGVVLVLFGFVWVLAGLLFVGEMVECCFGVVWIGRFVLLFGCLIDLIIYCLMF